METPQIHSLAIQVLLVCDQKHASQGVTSNSQPMCTYYQQLFSLE